VPRSRSCGSAASAGGGRGAPSTSSCARSPIARCGFAQDFNTGIIVQVEKTVPLEDIQDVTIIEGPLLKRYNLATLKFETAGHSAGQAHDMQLTGIIDAHEFKNRILELWDERRDELRHEAAKPAAAQGESQTELMKRMVERLDEIAGLLRERN
jgi:putative membrane protein